MNLKLTCLAIGVAAAFSSTGSAAAGAAHPAVDRAVGQIRAHMQETHTSPSDAFSARDVVVDADGSTHVRLDRRYKGLPVIGGDLVVHLDARGRYRDVSQTLHAPINLDIGPLADDAAAVELAESMFVGQRDGAPKVALVVYARGEAPALAYDVLLTGVAPDGTPSERHFILDALGLASLDEYDAIQTSTAAGTGQTLVSGTVPLSTDLQGNGSYALRDLTRGSHYVVDLANRQFGAGTLFTDADNVWGNFSTSNRATVAADAAFGQNLTWDYYRDVLGRNGIANDGAGAYSRVHYGRNYSNAYWSDGCFCMTYGDGNGSSILPLVAIDVAGHEMTHGLTSRTAALIYSGESGGLNESISDMLGTVVEYSANNPVSPPDYLIGERIYSVNVGVATPTTAIRYLFKPSLDGTSPDCYSSSVGKLDVHYSSGIGNHFFYLLTQGAVVPAGFSSLTPSQLVCNGNTSLTAISRDDAAKIIYTALRTYMTSSTNYAGARSATLNAASSLFGSSSTQYSAVAAAWSAVGVN